MRDMQHDAAPLHDVSYIETPEHVGLRFGLAGVASRGFAFMLDFMLQLVPMIAALVIAFVFAPTTVAGEAWVQQNHDKSVVPTLLAQAVAALAVFFVNFGYFSFLNCFGEDKRRASAP